MNKIFVIAGTHEQFISYRKRITEELISKGIIDFRYADIVYVSSANSLRGISNPHGVFIGTWRERDNIMEILEVLNVCSHGRNQTILNLIKEME